MGIKDRLRRLEDRQGRVAKLGSQLDPLRERLWERLFHEFENGRRELHGLGPLPDLLYTEEDREDDRRFLAEAIPEYRASRGWQTEEAQAVLDYWEQHTREKLEKGAKRCTRLAGSAAWRRP